ncbi:Mbov_0401 family ICE element transposase-like protein [Mycoplasma miroungirhinis]|uniref:Transposase n=1 Tax=Mycoplasma miroungirhinis TaxID=754516 RepID=A0A6M4JD09_9MOLU|nr:hypothetical protein [Mycoplasma miroungirhinis]QJR44158.1 hypothetical protein HLA92_01785 [Mycoplasma miroungirhinis]
MYEYIENNKHKRVVYYHDKILENLAVSKYDFELIKACILADLNNIKIPSEIIKIQPSKQHLFFLKKRFKINEQISLKNDLKIEENKSIFKASKNEKINLEVDDLFVNIQGKKYGEKLRCREAILHTNFIKNKSKKSAVLCLFFLKKVSDKNTETNDLNWVSSNLNHYLNSLNIDRNSVILKGDGARWMKTISFNINVKYTLDYFHLVKKINETFGFNHFAKKENKKVFLNWFSKKYRIRWLDLFRYVFSYECNGGMKFMQK